MKIHQLHGVLSRFLTYFQVNAIGCWTVIYIPQMRRYKTVIRTVSVINFVFVVPVLLREIRDDGTRWMYCSCRGLDVRHSDEWAREPGLVGHGESVQ